MIHGERGGGHWRGVVYAAAMGLLLAAGGRDAAAHQAQPPVAQGVELVCPMHPDVRSSTPGTCPICGMTLVEARAGAPTYQLDLATTPDRVVPRRPFQLQLTVRDVKTGTVVKDFEVVHARRFHLFVIGHDLEHYDHAHPDQQPDGSWAVEVTVPRPGQYHVYSDFLPSGGHSQVIERSFTTAGFDESPGGGGSALVADRSLTRTLGEHLAVTLELPSDGLVAGREQTLVHRLSDPRTGTPVVDVEPYLGAWGHALMVRQDLSRVIHAHPAELVPENGEARGGPTLNFHVVVPEPGLYRLWTQIKRNGRVSTAVFTVSVAPGQPGGPASADGTDARRHGPRGR